MSVNTQNSFILQDQVDDNSDDISLDLRIKEAYKSHIEDAQNKLSIKTIERQSSKEFKERKKSYEELRKSFESSSNNLESTYTDLINTSETLTTSNLKKTSVQAKIDALNNNPNIAQKQLDQLNVELSKLDVITTQSTKSKIQFNSLKTTLTSELENKKSALEIHLKQYETLILEHYQQQFNNGLQQIDARRDKYLTFDNNPDYTKALKISNESSQQFSTLRTKVEAATNDKKLSDRPLTKFSKEEVNLIDKRKDAQVVLLGYEQLPLQYNIARAWLQSSIANLLNQENKDISNYLNVFTTHNNKINGLFTRKLNSYQDLSKKSLSQDASLKNDPYLGDAIFVKTYVTFITKQVTNYKPEQLESKTSVQLPNFVNQARRYLEYTKNIESYRFQRNLRTFIKGITDTYTEKLTAINADKLSLESEKIPLVITVKELADAKDPSESLATEGFNASTRITAINNQIGILLIYEKQLVAERRELQVSDNNIGKNLERPTIIVDSNSLPTQVSWIKFDEIDNKETQDVVVPFLKTSIEKK